MKRAGKHIVASALALCVLLCCTLPAFGAPKQSDSALSLLSFSLETDDTQEPITGFVQDGTHVFVFLPSYARMRRVRVCLPDDVGATLDNAALSNGMDCGAFRTETEYALRVGNETGSLCFLQAQNVAALYVHTQSGSMEFVHTNKTEKEQARLLLVDADGSVVYQSSGADKIRGRGNSTWSMEKKPYNLYLQTPADLLGMGEATDWALLANAFDETNLRNHVLCDFAQRVSGDPGFAPDTAFADVYLNGEYAGLYLLSEKTQIAENRLEISPESMLFSWVKTMRNDSFFALNSTSSVQIESPKVCTNAQQDALRTYLLAFQDALETGGDWQTYIDLDSFARKYLMEEVFLNYDVYNSQYFYREPNGKLFAGPCWDYDLTLGISWRNTWSTPNGYAAQNKPDENETWYSELWKEDVFRERVKTLFRTEYLPLLEALADGGIRDRAAEISASSEMNARRWRNLFGKETSDEAVRDMTQFLTRRIEFLKSVWIDETDYCTLTLCHPDKYIYINVLPNTVCADFPQPQEVDLPKKTVWLREDTGKPFDPQSVITEDLTLKLPQTPKPIAWRDLLVLGALAAMAAVIALAVAIDLFRRHKRRR